MTANTTKLVGCSLSGCIRDIIKGIVDIENVALIIAGTRITSRDQLPAYAASEVSPKHVDAFLAAAQNLWDRGAIFQACTLPKKFGAFAERWRDASESEARIRGFDLARPAPMNAVQPRWASPRSGPLHAGLNPAWTTQPLPWRANHSVSFRHRSDTRPAKNEGKPPPRLPSPPPHESSRKCVPT